MTGQRFGRLVVIQKSEEKTASRGCVCLCKCDCGKQVLASTSALNSSTKKSCSCLRTEVNHSRLTDSTGQRFGRLVAIEYIKTDDNSNALWRCKCDCGNEKIAPSITLVRGDCNSCGCLKDEQIKEVEQEINKRKSMGLKGNKNEQ